MFFLVGRRRLLSAFEECDIGGYTLPSSLLAKTKVLSKVRFYVSGSDLWEHSNISDGWDPEASSEVDNAKRYPFLRTVTFGLNLTF